MRSIVVMTYYQLMHATAMALTFNEKPKLYFSVDYLSVEDDLIEKIKKTDVFDDVIPITKKGDLKDFTEELKKTEGATEEEIDEIGDSLFEKYLETYYGEKFKDADKDDDIYVYNDFQWYYYYITKHFKRIVGVEDGYDSLLQQSKIHSFRNVHVLLEAFVGKYYPQTLFKNPNVFKVISSSYHDDLPDYLKEKLEVKDFNDIIAENPDEYSKAIKAIFVEDGHEISDDSVLVIAQGLQRRQYCTTTEEYILHKKIIDEAFSYGRKVYVKPHPASKVDIRPLMRENVVIMDKNFPIEVLEYSDVMFNAAISFGSTATQNIDFARKNIKIYDEVDSNEEKVKNAIQEYIKDEYLSIRVFFNITEMTPENYIRVFSYVKPHDKISVDLNLSIDEEYVQTAKEYYSKDNISQMIELYYRDVTDIKETSQWKAQIKRLGDYAENFPENVTISICGEDSDQFDYVFFAEEQNYGFHVMKSAFEEIEDILPHVVTYPEYSENDKFRINLGTATLGTSVFPRIKNKLLSRFLLDSKGFELGQNTEIHKDCYKVEDIVNLLKSINIDNIRVKRRYITDLSLDRKYYECIEDGEKFYTDLVKQIDNLPCESDKESGDLDKGKFAALIFLEYLNWMRITAGNIDRSRMEDFIDSIDIDPETKYKGIAALCTELVFEKDVDARSIIGKNRDFYKYGHGFIEKAVNEKVEGEMKNKGKEKGRGWFFN